MNDIITTQSIKTMSTREIAELIEKQHNHIKVSADRLAEKGIIGTPATREFTHNGNVYTEYLLNKRDSLILVAQNCPEYTARIVDRWQYLEEQAAKPIDPMAILSDPAAMRGLLLSYTEKVIALEGKVSEQSSLLEVVQPKAEALDRIATFSEGAMCITNAAKALQVQPKKLFDWLKEKQWIYRRAGGSGWVGYQSRIQVGFLEHKVTTIERTDGSTKQAEQVLVTAKGLAKLATDFGSGQLMFA